MIQSSLDAAAKKHALDYLGESEDVAKDAVIAIKRFLEDNSNINGRSDDRSILYFLRSCKFDLEKTQKKIKK
jgi:hypothetical protein